MTTFLSTLFVLLGVYVVDLSHGYYRGRHVCTERKKVPRPVPVTQTYRKPVYRKDLRRYVYVTAHRTVFKMEMKTQLYRTCCQGWEKRVPREVGCIVPVCKEKCLNGGKCIAPEVCMCKNGYTGQSCQIDINECLGRHTCQQKCINLPGSYKCACRKGFQLADDEMSCDLCLTCTPEFQSMQDQISRMGKQITDLEEEKKSLQSNLTLALTQYEDAYDKIERLERSEQKVVTSLPPTTKNAYVMADESDKLMPLDRLASLSQQISILEERMGNCACESDEWLL